MATSPSRRRQRNTRLTVATALLVLAGVVVLGALASGSFFAVAIASIAALVFGVAATRITKAELAQTRRQAAADRARQAREFMEVAALRAAENKLFIDDMNERIEARQTQIGALERELETAQAEAAEAQLKVGHEARRAERAEVRLADESRRLDDAETRAAEAIVLVAELEQEIVDLKAELVAWADAAKSPKRATPRSA